MRVSRLVDGLREGRPEKFDKLRYNVLSVTSL